MWINVAPVTSITGDITIYHCHMIKGNDVTTLKRKVPHGLLSTSCFYWSHLTTLAPVQLEIKGFSA